MNNGFYKIMMTVEFMEYEGSEDDILVYIKNSADEKARFILGGPEAMDLLMAVLSQLGVSKDKVVATRVP